VAPLFARVSGVDQNAAGHEAGGKVFDDGADQIVSWGRTVSKLPRHKGPTMIDAERREKDRLRSERWRAHGIGPRRPAQRPWLAAGVSRRKQRARQASAGACACATFERAEAFAAALARDLARCAALERETVAILAELTALTAGGRQAMV
jgi:hypothetical protein